MLATLGALPTGGGWAYEYKWDGVRAVVYVSGDDVRILSRNERDVTASYPDIADAVRGSGALILDGEIVAPDAHGRPSFGRLQRRMNVRQPSAALISGTPLHYNVFDLLGQDGESLLSEPYTARRERLAALGGAGFQLTASLVADTPDAVVAESRRLGLEGALAVLDQGALHPYARSRDFGVQGGGGAARRHDRGVAGGGVPGGAAVVRGRCRDGVHRRGAARVAGAVETADQRGAGRRRRAAA